MLLLLQLTNLLRPRSRPVGARVEEERRKRGEELDRRQQEYLRQQAAKQADLISVERLESEIVSAITETPEIKINAPLPVSVPVSRMETVDPEAIAPLLMPAAVVQYDKRKQNQLALMMILAAV